MTSRCAGCPVAEGLSCPSAAGHPWCRYFDPADPAYDPAYAAAVLAIAGERSPVPPPAPSPPVEQLRYLRRVRRFALDCFYGDPPAGGCGCVRHCHARRGSGVVKTQASLSDCGRCAGEAGVLGEG